jgi:hypothetical protein
LPHLIAREVLDPLILPPLSDRASHPRQLAQCTAQIARDVISDKGAEDDDQDRAPEHHP